MHCRPIGVCYGGVRKTSFFAGRMCGLDGLFAHFAIAQAATTKTNVIPSVQVVQK